jgi:hypothetical protein
MKIGEKTLRKGGEMLTNIMLSYISKINEAFLHNGESELKIGLDLTIKPGAANGNFKLQSGIKFVTEQIKDTFSDSCDELQTNLFDANQTARPCYLRPDGDQVFDNVCNKCNSRMDLIFVSGGKELPRIVTPDEMVDGGLGKGPGEMIQTYSCPAWADQFYKEWCDIMVAREIEVKEQPKLKKIAGGKR